MKLSSHDRIIKIVLSGLFAAIIFVLTAFFPIPLGHGYANAGDVFVVLSGIMMGPWAGLAAAGVGSAMADLYLGYSVYAPATFVIKGLMAVVACLIFKSLKNKRLKTAVSYIVCELIMVSGYFLFETIFFGIGVALADIVGNLLQAAFGAAVGITLTSVLMKTRVMNEYMK
ncbi:MAG: ECF transporter S component [Clostridia bacterium]|nr:ECF transporter S component [Clostridia bacterium]MBQ5771090.1 ECF transporter S component [Clostridia bacterium]